MRGREYTLASGEDRLLHVGRHPAVNAVADDVVELPQRGEIHAPNVLIDELDVVHAEFPYPQTSVLDLRGRQIDSHRPRPGIGRREREQVARGCTTDLQHARVDTSGVSNPKTQARAARCPGADCGWANDSYGASS
jgi:hypothetical protein